MHVVATQYAEEIDDLIQRTDVIDVTAESSSDDEAPPRPPDSDDELRDPAAPAADDDAGSRRIQADEQAERERIRREEADAEFARRLAEGPVGIDVTGLTATSWRGGSLRGRPATPLLAAPRDAGTHLRTRRLRVACRAARP